MKSLCEKTADIDKNNLRYFTMRRTIMPYINLFVRLKSNTEASIEYVFNMQMEEELPIYMENMIGMLMKKILLRVKSL